MSEIFTIFAEQTKQIVSYKPTLFDNGFNLHKKTTQLVTLDSFAASVVRNYKDFLKKPQTLPSLMNAIEKMESYMKSAGAAECERRQLKIEF